MDLMSRTADRTLLASLGFADPDHKDRRHTLACQYLAQPEVAQKVLARCQPAWVAPFVFPDDPGLDALCGVVHPDKPASRHGRAEGSPWSWWTHEPHNATARPGRLEVAITRAGGYLVGFWDVVVPVEISRPSAAVSIEGPDATESPVPRSPSSALPSQWAAVMAARNAAPPVPAPALEWKVRRSRSMNTEIAAALYIEVKAGPCDVGDLVRQLATYRTVEPQHRAVYVAATCWPMSAADRATLTAANVHHVRLGAGFEDYMRARAVAEDAGGWDV